MTNSTKRPILIVDDDPDDREMIRDAFLENKYQQNYVFIEDGEKLMDYLYNINHRRYPCLILLDLNMPRKDGREALKEIKENKEFNQIPTIILSTSSSSSDRQISYELGANCFVTKPDSYTKLVDITKSIGKLWFEN
jgi:CheY-like chemotaxis protein